MRVRPAARTATAGAAAVERQEARASPIAAAHERLAAVIRSHAIRHSVVIGDVQALVDAAPSLPPVPVVVVVYRW